MNIGFDAKRIYQNKTGLGHYSRTLISSLLKYFPVDNYFLFAPKKTTLFSPEGINNLNIIEPSSFLSKKLKSFWRSSWVIKDLLKNKIDLYHGLSHEIPRGISATSIKSVVTIHDLIFEIYPHQYNRIDRLIYRNKFRYACENADHIIAISMQTKKDITQYYGIDANKITVCYQGCDERFMHLISEEEKELIRNQYALPKKYFLYVGSIIERKNLLTICKAMKLLPDNSLTLVVIGNGDDYKKKIKKYLSENALEKRVIFLSESPHAKENLSFQTSADFPAIYQMATAFIYPSIYEGFGIPILEALWSGTPVITTNLSCMPETAADAALYIPAFDENAMAIAMTKIAENETLANNMKVKGWKHAQNFTTQKTSEAVMNVYKNVMYATRY